MVIGHLLVTNYPQVFDDGSVLNTDVKEIHQKQITPDHKVCDLFGDWKCFRENMRNMFRYEIVSFKNHTHYPKMDKRKRREHLRKVQLFQEFQLDGVNGDGVDQALQDRIAAAIGNGNLSEVLKLGLKGMNSDYISFLIEGHEEFLRRVATASHLEEQRQSSVATKSTTYRKKAYKLAKEWCEPDFILTLS
jgi:hypothetical protein